MIDPISAIGTVGNLVMNAIGVGMQNKANQQNIELANTQYQRAKEDAIKAGFSPLVAAGVQPSNVTVAAPVSSIENMANLFGGMTSTSLGANYEQQLNKAQREWQSNENEKERINQWNMNEANITSAEKQLAQKLQTYSSIAFQNRELQKYLQTDRQAWESFQNKLDRSQRDKVISQARMQLENDYEIAKKQVELQGKQFKLSKAQFIASNIWKCVDTITGFVNPIGNQSNPIGFHP